LKGKQCDINFTNLLIIKYL